MYTSNVEVLREIAREMCKKYDTLCYDERDPDDIVMWGFVWVENFYHLDPTECSQDLSCLNDLFDMHSEVTKLALEGKYEICVDREMLERALASLQRLKSCRD